jgi:beta-barrel assembly-enhancing protease
MKKIIIHLITTLALFLGLWYILSNINFVSWLKIEEFSKSSEEKLSQIIIDAHKKESKEITDEKITELIDSIKNRICIANQIDYTKTTIYIFENSDINAFALPANKIIIYSGLIKYCSTPEELASVLAHELAHIEQKHIVKKLISEIGFSVLNSIIGGEKNAEVIKALLRNISSNSYSRELEDEADLFAVNYLINAQIDPEHYANLLYRLAFEKGDVPNYLKWVSTHPETKERATKILELRKEKTFTADPLFNSEDWIVLKLTINH